MDFEVTGAEDRTDEGVPQPYAQRQGDCVCAAYAQHQAGLYGKILEKLVRIHKQAYASRKSAYCVISNICK